MLGFKTGSPIVIYTFRAPYTGTLKLRLPTLTQRCSYLGQYTRLVAQAVPLEELVLFSMGYISKFIVSINAEVAKRRVTCFEDLGFCAEGFEEFMRINTLFINGLSHREDDPPKLNIVPFKK